MKNLTQPTHSRRSRRSLRSRTIHLTAAALLFSATILTARAESCVTQAQMPAADREALAAEARKLTANVLSGDAGALRDDSTPDLQRDFAGVAQAVAALRDIAGGTVTVRNLYLLDNTATQPTAGAAATDAPSNAEVAQFFCGAYNTPQHVTFTLPGLKAGRYAVVMVHVTNVDSPRQLSFVLQDVHGWKLGGFIARPLQQGGHDGVWYWQRARELLQKHELWNADLCFQIAKQLLTPVGFLSSANLEKLVAEQQAATPEDWPTELRPLLLTPDAKPDSKPVKVTEMAPIISPRNTSDLSLSLQYQPQEDASATPLTTRNQAIAKELLRKIPELRELFTLLVVTEVSAKGEQQSTVVSVKSLQ